MPVIVIKDSKSGSVAAELVPRKGAEEYAIEVVKQIIEGLGYDRVMLKSDQEHSIVALKKGSERKDKRRN